MIVISNSEKSTIVETRMRNIAREAYNLELTIKMYQAYGEKQEVIDQAISNHAKQIQAYDMLVQELATLQTIPE